MITEIIKERQTISTEISKSTGSKLGTEVITTEKTKTPLTIKQTSTDQRELALKSQGYSKLDEDNYYKKLDEENQHVKFIRFKNNRLSIFERKTFLEIGYEIFNGPINYLEDIQDYL